jgi:hypothetical protein
MHSETAVGFVAVEHIEKSSGGMAEESESAYGGSVSAIRSLRERR